MITVVYFLVGSRNQSCRHMSTQKSIQMKETIQNGTIEILFNTIKRAQFSFRVWLVDCNSYLESGSQDFSKDLDCPITKMKSLDLNLFKRSQQLVLQFLRYRLLKMVAVLILYLFYILGPKGVPNPMVEVLSIIRQCNLKVLNPKILQFCSHQWHNTNKRHQRHANTN